MVEEINHIRKGLSEYKRKYFINQLIRGLIFYFAAIFTFVLVFGLAEYWIRFSSGIRVSILLSFGLLNLFSIYKWLLFPIKGLVNHNIMADDVAANSIGSHFSQVGDKLINILQLERSTNLDKNSLVAASIAQKSSSIINIKFPSAININFNINYVYKYLLFPLLLITIFVFVYPNFIGVSTHRIVHFNKEFIEPCPYKIIIKNKELKAYKNESYVLNVSCEGDTIPHSLNLEISGTNYPMVKGKDNQYSFEFNNLSVPIDFNFESNELRTKTYHLDLVNRPVIAQFEVQARYPLYLKKKNQKIEDVSSINIPEGTELNWKINVNNTKKLSLKFENEELKPFQNKDISFQFKKTFKESSHYEVIAKNEHGSTKEKITYNINVIKDRVPNIIMESYQDTTLFNYLLVGGRISDDYGFSKLRFIYKINDQKEKSIAIPFQANITDQKYYYQASTDSLKLKVGDKISYYVEVWDNDGINGAKSARSTTIEYALPSQSEIEEKVNQSQANTDKSLESVLKNAENLNEEIKDLNKNLKTKKTLEYTDRKDIENVVNEHSALQKEIEQLKKELEKNSAIDNKFNEYNEEIIKKNEQIQKILNEVIDDETKALMEELQRLMEENADKEDLNKAIDNLEKSDENMINELDRTLDMMRQMKFEKDLKKISNEMHELAKKQEKLAEMTEKKEISNEVLKEEQEYLNKDFKKLEEKYKELEKYNEELKQPNELEDFSKEQKSIEEDMKDSKEKLSDDKNKKAAEQQKGAAQKMKDLAKKMDQMQEEMQTEQAQENLDNLRDILDNLVHLSFDQEELMKNFKTVRQQDPRYVELSQIQLKLKDDAEVIKDSLLALAKRVTEIESFITRELTEMNNRMIESTEHLKNRYPSKATASQQYAMTSMNNLALLLDDVMAQMQQQMAEQKEGDQSCEKPGKNKKGKKGSKPDMGKMQKDLNQMIQDLKNGQKSGKQLSKEVAEAAQQQERIRRALKELEGMSDKDGNKIDNKLNEIKKMMEEAEKDIVHQRFDAKSVNRQQDILTKLLEVEKSVNQRDFEDKREANQPKKQNTSNPPAFEEYIKLKEKQIELMKSIPPSLNPYYKEKVNDYFELIEK